MADNAPDTTFDAPRTCTLCRFPSWSTEPSDEYEISLESFAEVRALAEKGCNGCKLFVHVWQYTILNASDREKSSLNFNRSSGNLWVHIFTDNRVRNIEVFTVHGGPSFKHVRVAGLLPPNTHLEHNLSRMQTWLSVCERDHARCSVPSSYTPLRLLDIGLQDSGIIKLVELSSPPDISTQYACLSHCWGKTRSKHITHTGNLSINMTGIPVSELPKTFRDAVGISRALQLRYLWIDSLCIVQNSESDWSTHVQVMASIYENAFITLAAGASEDDDGGFFAEPSESYTQPSLLSLDVDEQSCNVYVRCAVDHPDAEWPAGDMLPLMERGWCFQERLLSRRYLCFGNKEIIWECLNEVACPCSMAPGPFNPRASGTEACFRDCPAIKSRMSSPNADYTSLWRRLVSEYSSRRLTYPNDKLPALAGLAITFQRKFETGPYLHGMWTSSIAQDLGWKVWGNDAPLGRPRTGPSWSWAYSMDSSIEWPDLCTKEYYRVLGVVDGRIENEDRTATVLSLAGTLLAVSIQTWTQMSELERIYSLTRYSRVIEHGHVHYSSPTPDATHPGLRYPPLPGSIDNGYDANKNELHYRALEGHFNADYKFWASEEDLQHELQNVVFFALGVEHGDDGIENCWVSGMILRPTTDGGAASISNGVERFERVGWLQYCTEKTKTDFVLAGTKTNFLLV